MTMTRMRDQSCRRPTRSTRDGAVDRDAARRARPAAARPRSRTRGDPHDRRRAAERRAPRHGASRARCRRCARRSSASSPTTTAGASGEPRTDVAEEVEPRHPRGFELREVGGGWRIYVRAEYDDARARLRAHPDRRPSSRRRPSRRSSVIAYKQPISRLAGRVDPRGQRRLGRAHAARPRTDHRGRTPTPRPARSTTRPPSCCSPSSASTRSTSCRTSRRCSTTARKDSMDSDRCAERRHRAAAPRTPADRGRAPAEGARGGRRRSPAGSPSSYIVEGRVEVNGEIVTELGSRVDPAIDLVAVDGVAVQLDPAQALLHAQQAARRRLVDARRAGAARPAPVHRRPRGAGLQRRPPRRRDERAAHPHQRRRPRARARASVVRRLEDVHREGARARSPRRSSSS